MSGLSFQTPEFRHIEMCFKDVMQQLSLQWDQSEDFFVFRCLDLLYKI